MTPPHRCKSTLVILVAITVAAAGWRFRISGAETPAPATDPAAVVASDAAGRPTAEPNGAGHALLVGVTRYPSLPPERQLAGPANDVELMRSLLREKFGFLDQNIVTLKEGSDSDLLPTHDHILRALNELASRARPGDKLVVYFSGHGALQPHVARPGDTRPQDLDDLFLPSDVGKWDHEVQAVTHALVDREVSDWVKGLRTKQVSLWLIVDACHSGGLAHEKGRGGPASSEVDREVPPDELGIPAELARQASRRAQHRSEKIRGIGAPDSGVDFSTDMPGVAATYACRSIEATVEASFPADAPADSPGVHRYGMFTYTLDQVLSQAAGKLTYAELVRRINSDYAAKGRNNPIPLVEGTARDQEVLGETIRKSDIRLTRGGWPKRLQVNVGRIHGFHDGTIFAVYPPPGERDANRVLGYVRIGDASALTSDVTPCQYNKVPALAEQSLKNESVCRPEYVDFGIEPLRVYVTPKAAARLGAALPRLAAEQKSLFTLLPAPTKDIQPQVPAATEPIPANAEFIVGLAADGLQLVVQDQTSAQAAAALAQPTTKPALAAPDAPSTPPPPDVAASQAPAADEGNSPETRRPIGTAAGRCFAVPAAGDGDAVTPLAELLKRIAQARSLLKIGTAGGSSGSWSDRPEVSIEMGYCRGRDDEHPQPVKWPANGITLRDGDVIALKLWNHSDKPVDMTLLFIDSGYGIKAFFPRHHMTPEACRVKPGDFGEARLRINGTDTFGPEQVVLIAVTAEGGPYNDFRFLEQPTLEQAREQTRGGPGNNALDSPLGRMLQAARYHEGTTRGASEETLSGYDVKIMNWWTNPAAGAAAGGGGR